MGSTPNELLTALVMLLGVVALLLFFLWYKRSNTERRLRSMLERQGLDPRMVRQGDTKAILDAIRQRCSRCQTEAVCERWLAGDIEGDNDFCPNAQVIKSLAEPGKQTP